jgi:dipeptidyl-peptidase-4
MTRAQRPCFVSRFLCAALLLAPAFAAAQALPKLTVERLHAEPPLTGTLPSGLAWRSDARLTFLHSPGPGRAADLVSVDPATGQRTVLLVGDSVRTPAEGGSEAGKPLPLAGYTFASSGDFILVAPQGIPCTVALRDGTTRCLSREPVEFPSLSPDGRRLAFVRGHDLYLVDLRNGKETRLTQSGSDTVLNGRLDWVYEEELGDRLGRAYLWAPNSNAIAYLQLDQGRVATFPIVDFLPVQNSVAVQRYPTAGTPNSAVKVGVIGINRDGSPGPERFVSLHLDDGYLAPQLAFSPDSRALLFQQLDRDQKELQLRLVEVPDAPTRPLGAPRTLLTEHSSSWVNLLGPPQFLKDSRRFLWQSERSGFAHLNLCDTTGSCRAMTSGPFVVQRLLHVDERTGFAFFLGNEKDARERHLYRVRLDGTGRARLTREDGWHESLVSPDGRSFADTWSSLETAPRVLISSLDGTRRHLIEPNDHPPIYDYQPVRVEWVDLQASDGSPLHAMLTKPADFDEGRRYPVVVAVYGGPGVQTVRNAWGSATGFERMLASRGFLVWSLDNRGSSGRGLAFEAVIHKELGRVELEDQLAGIAYLKGLPYVDSSRLGIYGWSYGGFLSLYAVTRAPEVFRAAVAGAPVTDWTLYDSIYTERYLGTPASNLQGYQASSVLAKACDLRAELLLIHGTGDDNVHLANSMRLVDALIRAGRPHHLLLHPGQLHGLSAREDRVFRDQAVLRHFETYLLPR